MIVRIVREGTHKCRLPGRCTGSAGGSSFLGAVQDRCGWWIGLDAGRHLRFPDIVFRANG